MAKILGIVNLTPDSYYAPSRTQERAALLHRVGTLVEEGADGIDLGAASSRPGSVPVGADEEWARLEPALEAVREAFPDVPLSIDTYRAAIVEKAVRLIGKVMVNDISAGAFDPGMLETVSGLGLPYIAMHLEGTPQTMHTPGRYPRGVTDAVLRYFEAFARRASDAGLREWILDPGFGFSKSLEDNWTLLRELDRLQPLQRPILVGISRKSMIYKLFGITPEEALPATQAAHLIALQKGAEWLRVHDVAEARRTVEIYSRM